MATLNALPQGTILKTNGHQYKIEKVIGHGAFGITYLAETSTKIGGAVGEIWVKVAVKEFFMHDYNTRKNTGHLNEMSGESIVEKYKMNFTKEANNLAKLSNRNIVKVLDVIYAYNTCYIVMEYISGSNLDEYIKLRGRLREDEALDITKDIAKAIGYMHNRKMLHLDLKPKNVMRDEDGGIHIIDFGLSKQYDNNGEPESSTTIGQGTPGYAPLEQGSPGEDNTFPITIDVYALGATLYKMLTGETPPSASTVLNSPYTLTNKLKTYNVSAKVIQLIKQAMQPSKDTRIPSMESFIRAIEDLSSRHFDEETEVDTNQHKTKKEPEKPRPPKPDSHMVMALISTLLCLPFGIVALVNAAKVDSLYYDKDYEGAEDVSDNACKWAKRGFYTWGALVVIWIIFIIIAVANS